MSCLHLQNMRLVVFDFDGTIADTSPGILDAHRYTLDIMGRIVPPDEELKKIIGGNLLNVYSSRFFLNEVDAKRAVRIYRERYARIGIYQAKVYHGIEDTLMNLKNRGFKLGVATLKAERFATIMLKNMNLEEYFDVVCGMDSNDTLDKTKLICRCEQICEIGNTETVLVGDSNNDWIGAQRANVEFIGVTYGFGFTVGNDYLFPTLDKPQDLLKLL